MKSDELRNAFIDFFKKKQHEFVAGCSIVPENDPSLLFINAGMNQFKDVFLGTGTRSYNRAVNSQVCVRVSGKHNDLEDVGKDSTHLTSFEMLGNWSFGDYYKKEAIIWAWELLTQILQIPKYRLVATVFEEDDEAEAIWKLHTEVGQVVRCDAKDNFWEMGKTGPCGPCSEIHVYLKNDSPKPGLTQADLNSGDFIELWNLVFIQYNRLDSGELENLAQKSIDTGAGFERLLAFMQGTPSNYQTDLFWPIIEKIEHLSGKTYSESLEGMPFRVMADHVRTLCFGIADNCYPSNEGRGYVLRRLLRRACRYAKKLGFEAPVLHKLVVEVIAPLSGHFEHLKQKQTVIEKVILAEEDSFLQTLTEGLKRFDTLKEKTKKISAEDAFKLYDTYGFPIDLSALLAEEAGLEIDLEGFSALLEKQKDRSRQASQFQDMENKAVITQIKPEDFQGLSLHLADDLNCAKGGEARIIADRNEKVSMARHHTATHILHEILRRNLGEHVHQAGSLVDSDRLRFDFSHFESINKDDLQRFEAEANEYVTQALPVSIDHMTLEQAKKRGAMALFGEKYNPLDVRVVNIGGQSIELCAGTHVTNTSDIEQIKIISETAISAGTRRIEALAGQQRINQYLTEQLNQHKSELMIQISKLKKDWSNLDNKKVQELEQKDIQLNACQENQNNKVLAVSIRLCEHIAAQIQESKKDLKKVLSKQTGHYTKDNLQGLLDQAIRLETGISLIISRLNDEDVKALRDIADHITSFDEHCIVLLGSENKDKGLLVVKYAKKIDSTKLGASDLVKRLTEFAGGSGGGRFDMAQAGGVSLDKLDESLDLAKELLMKTFQ